jgi:hypothetical protein
MGYLTDNLAVGQNTADCPELYPYAMVIDYYLRDKFTAPSAPDQLGAAMKEKLPDVEVWQYSVVKPNRVIFRFKDEPTRDTASTAFLSLNPAVGIRRTEFRNTPDRVL